MTTANFLGNAHLAMTLTFARDFLNATLPRLRALGVEVKPEKTSLREEEGKIHCGDLQVYNDGWSMIENGVFTPKVMTDLAKLLERKTFEWRMSDLAPRILSVNWRPADDYNPHCAATVAHQAKHFAAEGTKEKDAIADRGPVVDTVNFRTFSGEIITFPVSYAGMIELHNALCRAEAVRDLASCWPYFEELGWLVTFTDQQVIAHYGCDDHIYNFRPDEIQSLINDLRSAWGKKHAAAIPFGGTEMVVVSGPDPLPSDVIV